MNKATPANQKGAMARTVPTIHEGVNLAISQAAYGGAAQDYCEMRAAQLCALLNVISGEGHDNFAGYSDAIQDDVKWLARSLAEEIKALIPVVAEEGKRSTGVGA